MTGIEVAFPKDVGGGTWLTNIILQPRPCFVWNI